MYRTNLLICNGIVFENVKGTVKICKILKVTQLRFTKSLRKLKDDFNSPFNWFRPYKHDRVKVHLFSVN